MGSSQRRLLLIALTLTATTACGGAEDAGVVLPAFSQGKPPLRQPPANVVGGFSIDLPAEELAPGEERTPCYLFPLEIQGPSHIVGGGVLHAAPGMHHGNITTREKTGEGFRPCPDEDPLVAGEALDILHGGAVLFGSSTQFVGDEWQSFPDGVGFRIKDDYEIVARMHYLNTTSAPLTIQPRYEWFTIDEAKVVQEVGPFAWTYSNIEIPPHSEVTVGAQCPFPEPMHIVSVLPHMHAKGKAFTAEFLGGPLAGQRFLDSPGYDPDRGVLLQYDPAIDLGQGEGARFSCTWVNPTDKLIEWGIGDNEMCILFGYAWPPANAFSATATGEENCLALYPP
jgi:hypothetical protein